MKGYVLLWLSLIINSYYGYLYLRPGPGWTHMSCALWIPEVKIANVDRMEPVTNIDAIPVSNVADTEPWKYGFCILFR